jgi:hypothetical protein
MTGSKFGERGMKISSKIQSVNLSFDVSNGLADGGHDTAKNGLERFRQMPGLNQRMSFVHEGAAKDQDL